MRFVGVGGRIRCWRESQNIELWAIVIAGCLGFGARFGRRLTRATRFERFDPRHEDRVFRPHSSKLLLDRRELLVRGVATLGATHGQDRNREHADETSHS